MDQANDISILFNQLLELVASIGPPLAISVAAGLIIVVIFLGIVLYRIWKKRIFIPALIVGAVSLVAHLMDYIITIQMNPDLTLEMNPVWRIVIDYYGLKVALIYGLVGKILLAVFAFECFAFYLLQCRRLYPKQAKNFVSFWRQYGHDQSQARLARWPNILNFFCFALALIGPFYFYVAFMNAMINDPLHALMPPMLSVLLADLIVVALGYFILTYESFLERNRILARARRGTKKYKIL